MSLSNLLTFLRSFQNSPMFANIALHCWGGAMATEFFLDRHNSAAVVVGVGILLAALKEFWFDAKYEYAPDGSVGQPAGSISGGGGLQDFTGYVLGIGLGLILHHFT